MRKLIFLLGVFLFCLGMGTWLHAPGCALSCGGREVVAAAFMIAAAVDLIVFMAVMIWEIAKQNGND